MNLATIQSHFKRIAKIIWFAQKADTVKAELMKGGAGLHAQEASTETAEYARTYAAAQEVVVPFHAQVNGVVSQMTTLKANAKSAVQNYLQKVMAPELGLAAGVPVATVASSLLTEMNNASGTVADNGTLDTYFSGNFSISLPTGGSPNIDDAWVDDDVVV